MGPSLDIFLMSVFSGFGGNACGTGGFSTSDAGGEFVCTGVGGKTGAGFGAGASAAGSAWTWAMVLSFMNASSVVSRQITMQTIIPPCQSNAKPIVIVTNATRGVATNLTCFLFLMSRNPFIFISTLALEVLE